MVESNKMEVVKEHCRRLFEQIQEIHQELQELIATNKARWIEQDKKSDQISSQIVQMVEKEVGVNSRGILLNPSTGRDIETLSSKKGIQGFRSHNHGDNVTGQEHYKSGNNSTLPRMNL
jgi:regulator of replication initiation timing